MKKYKIEVESLVDVFKRIDNGNIIFDVPHDVDLEVWVLDVLQDILFGQYHHMYIELFIQPFESVTEVLTGVCKDEGLFTLRECFKRREGVFQYCVDLRDSTVSLSQPNTEKGIIPLYEITSPKAFYLYSKKYQSNTTLITNWERIAKALQCCVFSVVSIYPQNQN